MLSAKHGVGIEQPFKVDGHLAEIELSAMPKRPPLPERFAISVLAELAEIRSAVMALADIVMVDQCEKHGFPLSTVQNTFNENRKKHFDATWKMLSGIFDEPQNPRGRT